MDKFCVNCKKEKGVKYSKYASGNFCSKSCAKSFSTSKKRKEINKKVSIKLKGRKSATPIKKICLNCKVGFDVFKKGKNRIYCSVECSNASKSRREKISTTSKARCSTLDEKRRMRDIGRLGGFGDKGVTNGGIYYASKFEKQAFEFLEQEKLFFEPHKFILNTSKVTDIYLPKFDIWIELDGINREKRNKWLETEYQYWKNKIDIYRNNGLNFQIFTDITTFKLFIANLTQTVF